MVHHCVSVLLVILLNLVDKFLSLGKLSAWSIAAAFLFITLYAFSRSILLTFLPFILVAHQLESLAIADLSLPIFLM